MPSNSEISGENNQKRFEISNPLALDIGNTVSNTGKAVESSASKAADNVGSAVNNAANDIEKIAPNILSSMTSAFENFKPKIPVVKLSGLFSIPYLIAFMLSILALVFLSCDFLFSTTLCIVAALILNAIALSFDCFLFVWVFSIVNIIPGIESQKIGPAIHLSSWSFIFLSITTLLLVIHIRKKSFESVKKLGKILSRKLKKSPDNESKKQEILVNNLVVIENNTV